MPYMISEHHFQLLALAGDLIIKSTAESSPLLVMWVIATP
jgi:hypothetical protein